MSAAVIMPDGRRWAGVSGQSSVAAGAAVTADTPFVVGSITKTFTAATIMQLADEGRLSIDDPLSRWLPTYPRAADITLRMLLSHTSGVFNYFEHPAYNRRVFGDPTHLWTPQEILDTFGAPSYCAPGTCYHYSNTGFILLGLVVEKVTGSTLGNELRRRWFVPLGLNGTYFQGDTPLPPSAAQGHILRIDDRLVELGDGSDYRPTRSAASVAWAAGGIASTADDLATWCDALYGGHLLSARALAEMTDFAAYPHSSHTYGLGTRTRFVDGRRMDGHTGSLRGFYAAIWHFPVESLTVVIDFNLGRIDPNPMADRLARIALEAAGYPAPTPSPSPTPFVPPTRSPVPSLSPTPTASPTPSPTPTPIPLPSGSPSPSASPSLAPLSSP